MHRLTLALLTAVAAVTVLPLIGLQRRLFPEGLIVATSGGNHTLIAETVENPWAHVLIFVIALGWGWRLSGLWRGTRSGRIVATILVPFLIFATFATVWLTLPDRWFMDGQGAQHPVLTLIWGLAYLPVALLYSPLVLPPILTSYPVIAVPLAAGTVGAWQYGGRHRVPVTST